MVDLPKKPLWRMEAIRFNRSGQPTGTSSSPHWSYYSTPAGAKSGEYYPKPEADIEFAQLKSDCACAKAESEAIFDEIKAYRNTVARLESDLFQAQAKSSRLEARCGDLQDEVERLKELLVNTTERLNLIMIDLLGFGGAALSESNRIFLKSLYNFLEDDSGLSEKLIAEELERKGVDVKKLLKRTDDLIKKMVSNQALSGGM